MGCVTQQAKQTKKQQQQHKDRHGYSLKFLIQVFKNVSSLSISVTDPFCGIIKMIH